MKETQPFSMDLVSRCRDCKDRRYTCDYDDPMGRYCNSLDCVFYTFGPHMHFKCSQLEWVEPLDA